MAERIVSKAVIFDAGNTLLEVYPPWDRVIADYCRDVLSLPDPNESARTYIEAFELWTGAQGDRERGGAPRMPHEEFFRNMNLAGLRAVLPDAVDAVLTSHAERMASLLDERPWRSVHGVAELLADLKASGFTLGMVSNFTADLPNILDKENVIGLFDCIVVSDVVGIWKPDPAIMKLATEQLGIHPCQCVYVADHPFDVQCAVEAGMQMIWLNPSGRTLPSEIACRPDLEISCLEELSTTLVVA